MVFRDGGNGDDGCSETITVLTLDGDAYVEHGVFVRGQRADSVCVNGFAPGVAEVFDAA